MERKETKDLEAALAANPKQVDKAVAAAAPPPAAAAPAEAAPAAEATSPTVMTSPSQHSPQDEPTSPAETVLPPEGSNPPEQLPGKAGPAALIRVFPDGSWDVVTPQNPDTPVDLPPEESSNCLRIAQQAADTLLRAEPQKTAGATPADNSSNAAQQKGAVGATPATPTAGSGDATQQQLECTADSARTAASGDASQLHVDCKTEPDSAATGGHIAEKPRKKPAAEPAEAGADPATSSNASMALKEEADSAEGAHAADAASTDDAATEDAAEERGRTSKRRKRHRRQRPKSP